MRLQRQHSPEHASAPPAPGVSDKALSRPSMRNTMPLQVTWEEFHTHTRDLADALLEHYAIEGIIAVQRGGLVPGVILSHILDKPIICTIHPDRPIVTSERSDILVIDEVCDTGVTFVKLKVLFPNAVFASVYVKPQGIEQCHAWRVEVPQNVWIQFPWEQQ